MSNPPQKASCNCRVAKRAETEAEPKSDPDSIDLQSQCRGDKL
jgi:hypothetical protein